MKHLAFLLLTTVATPLLAQQCSDSFSADGNILTGKTYRTTATVAGVSRPDAITRLAAHAMVNGFTVLSQDVQLGQISAVQSDANAKGTKIPLNMIVLDDVAGVRVTLQYQTGLGQMSPDSAVKDFFCRAIAASSAASTPGASPLAKTQPAASARATPAGAPRGFAAITEAQRSSITAIVGKGPHPERLRAAMPALVPTISTWIERLSCMSDYTAAATMDDLAAPGAPSMRNMYMSLMPMMPMNYHDRNQCLSVVRVHGWQMPADNAVQFEVVYKAEDSGETAKTRHELVRQSDGVWLFTR